MRDQTTCAIAGGGPAGMILGLLLARAGVDVTVFEKHADFLRDFRGDTVHPTTLGLLDDLGLFEEFTALEHSRITEVALPLPSGERVRVVDFSRLPLRHPYIAMVPQWDLLDLLARAGRDEPSFTLRMSTAVTDVVRTNGRVTGVRYDSPDGRGELACDLVVACDGRHSTVRRAAALAVREFAVNTDVWWFRVPTAGTVGASLLPRFGPTAMLVAIPSRGYVQVAYLGRKGDDARLRARGIDALREEVAELLPEAADGVAQLASMDDVKHLDVRINRLRRWHTDGLLCIGDAAHAMSPIGGVGINLAVQDAVATARLLAEPLRSGAVTDRHLRSVRRRRLLPTVVIQAGQRLAHARLVEQTLDGRAGGPPPALLRAVRRFPALTAIPALLIGVGPRPERAPAWARRPAGRTPQPAA